MSETHERTLGRPPLDIFPLSARDGAVLRQLAEQLLGQLEALPPEAEPTLLPKIAYTLQVGRDSMDVRLVLRASDAEGLRAELRRKLASPGALGDAVRHDTSLGEAEDFLQRAADAALRMGDAGSAADLWEKGAKVDWNGLYPGDPPGRTHLPTYPFKLERYWITESRGHHGAPAKAAPAPQETTMTFSATPPARSAPEPAAPVATIAEPHAAPGPPLLEPECSPIDGEVPLGEVCMTLGELQDELSRGLAAALFMDPADIDLDETFFELGVESVSGVEWIRSLTERYGVTIKVSAIYDYPTLRRFAEFLYEQLGPSKVPLPQNRPAVSLAATGAPAAGEAADALAQITGVLARLLALPEDAFYPELSCDDLGLRPAQDQAFRVFLAERGVSDGLAGVTLADLAAQMNAVSSAVAPVPTPASATDFASGAYALVVDGPVAPQDAIFTTRQAAPPGPGEVSILVKASAINYPDVLALGGLWPQAPQGPFTPGREVAGVVADLGEGVEGLAVGDAVIAVLGAGLGGHAGRVNASAAFVIPKPAVLDFDQACGLPVAFLTAERAFEAAGLKRGETMLVHAALGGVGLMALQLAALRGATCFATSREISKRWKLKLMGLEPTASYRLGITQAVRAWAGDDGVDVVFNSIPEAARESAGLLAAGGRFLDLATHAPAANLPAGVRRLGVDPVGGEAPDVTAERLRRMVRMIETGEIVPLTTRVYPRSQLGHALALVARGEHVGRVVISHVAEAAANVEEATLAAVAAQRKAADVTSAPRQVEGLSAKPPAELAPVAAQARLQRTSVMEPIAVIGLSARFPMAADADAFWRNLAAGRQCISGLPLARWNLGEFAGSPQVAALYPHMGQLEEADMFDPLFFGISPKEARLMDPQQRIFMQACWACIEEAGYAPSSLAGGRCGVFAGCSGAGYGFGAKLETSTHVLMGHSSSILPARVAYHMDLKGPCLAIDTACSSSLVALADACTSLATGGCDLALAGGVQVFASPLFAMMATDGGMLSPDGRCFTFDSRANGFVPSEGVGVVLLKRLCDAEADGDQIHGVIRAWGVNHDGKTNGMTAPSVVSQAELERDVYARFGVDATTISCVEAHGTGTRLGDPIEVQALTESFRSHTDKQAFCALGSVKSNIGHTLAAAGIAGVLKVLLAMRHRVLPPTVNYQQTNQEIDMAGGPFFVNDRAQPWEPASGAPLRAAVSSFSYNGTNAHVVIDAPPARPERSGNAGVKGYPIVLSAKSDEQLTAQAAQLLRHVDEVLARGEIEPTAYLRDLAYTLQVGRDGMVERLGFVVSTLSGLSERLGRFVAGESSGAIRANVRAACKRLDSERPSEAALRARRVEDALEGRDPAALLQAWIEGVEIDWARLYPDLTPRRISLPTYPFAKRRFWFEDGPPERFQTSGASTMQPSAAQAVPLIAAGPSDTMTAEFDRLLGQLAQA